MIPVFVEVAAGSTQKHLYDEESFAPRGVRDVIAPYPYPYGFIPGTRTDDGEALDAYIITGESLKPGRLIECEVAGLLEFFEDGGEDHKLIAVLPGENPPIDSALHGRLREFIMTIFTRYPEIEIAVGGIQPREAALKLLADCR